MACCIIKTDGWNAVATMQAAATTMVLAVASFVLPMLALPIVFGGLLQFVFGLALPSNPLPNLMGYPKPDTPALKGFAALSFVVAVLLAAWLVWMR